VHSIVTVLERPPHQCISCAGSADRDWYVDLGDSEINAEQLYAVYVCNLCLTAIAQEQGLVDATSLHKEISEMEDKIFHLTVKADGLEQGLDGLLRSRFVSPDDPAAIELVDFINGQEVSDGVPSVGHGSGAAEGELSHRGEGATSEPSDDPNLAGLPADFKLDAGAG